MSDPRQPPDDAPPWEMAELISEHALDDVPWDRPAELPWPEPELDAITWNERWNVAAYDPDYPLPPQPGRTPGREAVTAAAAVAAGAVGGHALRFGRPIRDPQETEPDDPYDEYAPLADDLEAPGQLTWTGGTVPLRAAASAEGPPPAGPPQLPPPQPRPAVEPPTWSRSSRSVFGDYFAGGAGQPARSLPSPDPGNRPEAGRVEPPSETLPVPVDEWPPIPADFQPQWASVAPVTPAWSPAPAATKPARTPPSPPTWVHSSAPTTPARPPAPPPPRTAPLGLAVTPPLTPAVVAGGVATAALPAARPLPPVRPIVPARQAPPPAAPILPDDYYEQAQESQAAGDAEAEGSGLSTIWTLFWMAVTGIVVVGLVLAFLHFMTGVLR